MYLPYSTVYSLKILIKFFLRYSLNWKKRPNALKVTNMHNVPILEHDINGN